MVSNNLTFHCLFAFFVSKVNETKNPKFYSFSINLHLINNNCLNNTVELVGSRIIFALQTDKDS